MKKKITLSIICFIVLSVCLSSTTGANQLYDLNEDGVADVLDCFIAEREVATGNSSEFELDFIDINKDGSLSALDFKLFVRGVLGEEPKLKISDDNRLILSNFPCDNYVLKYENDSGVLEDYDIIGSVNVEDDECCYNGFNNVNCAPTQATSIGVYNSCDEKVGTYSINDLKPANLGEKKYSFAAISDTHIGSKTAEDDLINALQYFENEKDIEFTTVCGDLSLGGTETNLSLYKKIVDENTSKPVYAISGNHDANAPFAPLEMDGLKPYTGQDLYYSFEKDNDVYIMLGMYDVHEGCEFADGELQWLYEILEKNRNKRCFLFMHLFPGDGSGDAVNLDIEGDMLDNTQGTVFYSLLSHYSNVIYFHGHSHQKFELQLENKMNNYDYIFGCHSVHVPSLAYPKGISNGELVADYNASQGYVVDVYEDNVVLKGRDFVSGKFLPIASYNLDTELKTIEENTYFDSTGTIVNKNSSILKSGGSWYCGTADKKTITKITFDNNYTPTFYDESWDASISDNNQVVVYRVGTELFVCGNENGLFANSNSSEMFLNFTNLVEFVGFENLNVENITNMSGMFKNCNKLKSVDLTHFKNVKPTDMMNVFSGCKELKTIDLRAIDLIDVNKYTNIFYNCNSLEKVYFPNDASQNKTSIYCLNMYYNCNSMETIDMTVFSGKSINIASAFSGCSSLNSVKFGANKLLAFNSTFLNCNSLVTLDISGFDVSNIDNMNKNFEGCGKLSNIILPENFNTSKVKTMRSMFKDCAQLTLDCSGWDTASLTDITSFNDGAPNVIAPVIPSV